MADEAVIVRREGGAAVIELNRPEALNAWNKDLGLGLKDAILEVAEDDDVRAVMITGAGRAFSSGADLRDITSDTTPVGPPERAEGARGALPPDHRDDPLDAQAGARGRQRPGGRDRLLAGAGLRPDRRRGVRLLPAGLREHRPGARRRLLAAGPQPRRLHPRRARWRCSASASAPSRRAAWGLINRVVPDADFAAETDRAARPPGHRPDALLRRDEAPAQPLALQADGEQLEPSRPDIQQEMAESDDFVEGVGAFVAEARALPSAAR